MTRKDFKKYFSEKDLHLFKSLNTPQKVQNFLNTIPINFEEGGDTYYSPKQVLDKRTAHCAEGAVLAAVIFWYQGYKPLLLDLKTVKGDVDHVVALFNKNGYWGAISKTNHAVLRYREPIYKTVRELAMSYFHEYFLDNGKKTLRSYSKAFDLSKYKDKTWLTSDDAMWDLMYALDISKHFKMLNQVQVNNLRNADPIEVEAGKIVEYKADK